MKITTVPVLFDAYVNNEAYQTQFGLLVIEETRPKQRNVYLFHHLQVLQGNYGMLRPYDYGCSSWQIWWSEPCRDDKEPLVYDELDHRVVITPLPFNDASRKTIRDGFKIPVFMEN